MSAERAMLVSYRTSHHEQLDVWVDRETSQALGGGGSPGCPGCVVIANGFLDAVRTLRDVRPAGSC